MISIFLNEHDFEYDVYSLVRAFYPRKKARIFYVKETSSPYEDKTGAALSERLPEEEIQEHLISISYGDGKISVECDGEGGSVSVDRSDRPDTKNRLKLLLYSILSRQTGRKLPWGTLTGIRPTKLFLSLLEQGKSPEEITDRMQKTYRISREKSDLSLAVAGREKNVLSGFDYKNGWSLYIGIPFCPSICLYCSFSSYPIASYLDRTDDYLSALEKELAFTGKALAGRPLQTIYVGGGTPTSLSAAQLDRLFSSTERYLDLSHLLEVTVEAGRPDSVTAEKLAVLKKHGVDRISINPQTMNEKTLRRIGRKHTPEDIVRCFSMAREAGFSRINADLILGLPGEGPDEVAYTMEEIRKLSPENLTIHSLALKRSSRLNLNLDQWAEDTFLNSQELMDRTAAAAFDLRLFPYYLYRQKDMAGNLENIGYAAEGAECLYNILIMEEKQTIIALGAGSDCKYVVSPDSAVFARTGRTVLRSENVKDVDLYIARIDEMIGRKRRKLEEIQWL